MSIYYRLLFIVVAVFAGCSYMNNPLRKETHMLQSGRTIDTSSYIYDLPYPKGTAHWMVQGYFTQFTHKRRAALDFKMRVGSAICAARDGVVIRMKEDGNQGGTNSAARPHANFVIIEHADSSRSGYWHLKHDGVLVNVGDSVKKGQQIALSGNTGYSYFPHLHFIVWNFSRNRNFQQVATRFRTKNGPRYLKGLRRYLNPK